MLTQIDGYFRAGQPTRYLPRYAEQASHGVEKDDAGTGGTTSAQIDLGGGTLGSAGRNCIFGGAIYNLEATGYNVSAEHNWWGTASGPPSGTVIESEPGFKINTSAFLQQIPLVCSAN